MPVRSTRIFASTIITIVILVACGTPAQPDEAALEATIEARLQATMAAQVPTATPVPPTNTPEPTATPTATPSTDFEKVVQTDEWSVTVSDVRQSEWVMWNDQRLYADGYWLIVLGEAQNLTTDEIRLDVHDFELSSPRVRGNIPVHRDATGAAGLAVDIESSISGYSGLPVKPGQTVPLVIAFDVPDYATKATLQVVDAPGSIRLGTLQEVAASLPTPTMQPTATPRPTETATPTPTTPSVTEQEQTYLLDMQQHMDRLADGLSEVAWLFQNARIGDEDWAWDVAVAFVQIQQVHKAVSAIQDIPARFEGVHATILTATTACDHGTRQATEGLDTRNAPLLEEAAESIHTCTTLIEQAKEELLQQELSRLNN